MKARSACSGAATADITDGDEWLASLDRFGIVSDRAVLLDELTVEQNLAMTLTLDIDPVPADTRDAVARVAAEVALEPGSARSEGGDVVARGEAAAVRLGRAVALSPEVLLLEHPDRDAAGRGGGRVRATCVKALAAQRGLTVLAMTADAAFATALTRDAWTLAPADGTLTPHRGYGLGASPEAVRRLTSQSRARADGRAHARTRVRPGSRTHCFSITPHARRGPPLTPDLGSPVMPWSSLAWMIIAEPSASKSDSGPSEIVTRVVRA